MHDVKLAGAPHNNPIQIAYAKLEAHHLSEADQVDFKKAVDLLENWDYQMDKDSIVGSLNTRWFWENKNSLFS